MEGKKRQGQKQAARSEQPASTVGRGPGATGAGGSDVHGQAASGGRKTKEEIDALVEQALRVLGGTVTRRA